MSLQNIEIAEIAEWEFFESMEISRSEIENKITSPRYETLSPQSSLSLFRILENFIFF